MIAARQQRDRQHPQSRAGFTLLEMMVATVAGVIAISSIYYVSAASARHFHEQQRLAQSQMSLRMAMEHLRRDFARAGFLSSPNSDKEQTCMTTSVAVQAVQLFDDDDTLTLTEAATNKVEADRIILAGNYATADSYLSNGLMTGAGNSISIQDEWQSFRRSFGVPYDAAAFEAVFRTSRLLHINDTTGNHFFANITGSDGSTKTISFNPAMPLGTQCSPSLGVGAAVAPVNFIEYTVLDMSAASLASLETTSPLAGLNGPVLVRRELTSAGVPIANSERVILEYVANFDVDFVFDQETVVGNPPDIIRPDDATAASMLEPESAGGHPEQVRSAIIRLSVRTPTEDPSLEFIARTDPETETLTRYEVDPATAGSSRVRGLVSEVLLVNVAARGMR